MAKITLLDAFKNVATLSAQKAVNIIKGLRGKANGFASLDSNGKILSSEINIGAGSNVTVTPDTTNNKITISSSHPTITKSTDTTSTASPGAGGTVTMVDSVTRDGNGHVTKVNTKTVTLPITNTVVDSNLNSTSTNPIMNAAVAYALSKYLPLTGGTINDGLRLGSAYNSSWGGYDIVKADANGNLGTLKLLADGFELYSDTSNIKVDKFEASSYCSTPTIYGTTQSANAMGGQNNTKISYLNVATAASFYNGVFTPKLASNTLLTSEGWGYAPSIQITSSSFQPSGGGGFTLGSSSQQWGQIYSMSSTISTSDRNQKDNIEDLDDDKWVEFFTKLQPKSFTFINGTSGRTHVGFISQDVEEVMGECGLSSLDFAGFCKDQKFETIEEIEEVTIPADEENGIEERTELVTTYKKEFIFDEDGNPEYIYSLRYEEFIALNTMMIQRLCKKNKDFEDRLSAIEEKLNTI